MEQNRVIVTALAVLTEGKLELSVSPEGVRPLTFTMDVAGLGEAAVHTKAQGGAFSPDWNALGDAGRTAVADAVYAVVEDALAQRATGGPQHEDGGWRAEYRTGDEAAVAFVGEAEGEAEEEAVPGPDWKSIVTPGCTIEREGCVPLYVQECGEDSFNAKECEDAEAPSVIVMLWAQLRASEGRDGVVCPAVGEVVRVSSQDGQVWPAPPEGTPAGPNDEPGVCGDPEASRKAADETQAKPEPSVS